MFFEKEITKEQIEYKSKIWYGNPENEIIEGTIKGFETKYYINKKPIEIYSYENLELIKQFIWDFNLENSYIKSNKLCCINMKNKFSINEFIQTINTYLNYIQIIKIFKSPKANIYYIYLEFLNIEYCNIFYNTYNYSKINPIEEEFLIFYEINEFIFDEIYSTKRKSSIGDKNEIDTNNSSNINKKIKLSECKTCTICLEDFKNEGQIFFLCGHNFHIKCAINIGEDICPLCRYYISPTNISNCERCLNEKDLWICLVCGVISCGEEGGCYNHRVDHYKNTGHIYAQGLGEKHKIIFDFTKNCPVNIWIQRSILNGIGSNYNNHNNDNNNNNNNDNNNNNNDNNNKNNNSNNKNDNNNNKNSNNNSNNDKSNNDETQINTHSTEINTNNEENINTNSNNNNNIHEQKEKNEENKENENNENNNDEDELFKDTKEKSDYIMSEYNSIISSQLENQRMFYLNKLRKIEEKYILEEKNLEIEILKAKEENKNLDKELEISENKKNISLKEVKEKNEILKKYTNELKEKEIKYESLKKQKENNDSIYNMKTKEIQDLIKKEEEEIKDLNLQLKDLNIHLKTLNSIKSNKENSSIKNASIGVLLDVEDPNNKHRYKNKK